MGIKIGDKNKIKNSTLIGGSQTINNNSEDKPRNESFWKTVLNNIVSNFIWWIIGTIIIIMLGTLTAIKWDEIINFIMGR